MDKISLPPPPSKRLIKTALHQAVLDERLQQVRLLVDRHNANVDTKDVHGRTPLMLTCMIDSVLVGYRMAGVLLKAGADANLKDGMGRTALSYACMNDREHIVRLILKEDALNLNDADNDGNTSLHHAAACGNPQIARILSRTFQRFCINPDQRNNLGYTAFLSACKFGHYTSALYIMTIAKGSPTLRDGEFHHSAEEWIEKNSRPKFRAADRGPVASAPAVIHRPMASLAFERDDTMYQKPWVPVCRLYRSPNPYQGLEAAVRFPVISTSEDPAGGRQESLNSNMEARQRLMDEISRVQRKAGVSFAASTQPRWAHPPTAKLRAVAARAATAGSLTDMTYIFRMYSELYQPPWSSQSRLQTQNQVNNNIKLGCVA